MTLEPGALQRLRMTAEALPQIGMVGPRLLLLDGSTQVSVRPFPGMRMALLLALHADRFSARAARALRTPAAWEPPATAPVPWIAGALVLMSREAFTAAGGFDPDQWLYGEDLDLCWRMRQAGWEIVYEPAARVHHAHSAASAQRFESRRSTATSMPSTTCGCCAAAARSRPERRRLSGCWTRWRGSRCWSSPRGVTRAGSGRGPEERGRRSRQHLLGLRSERELERRVTRARGTD